MNDAAQRILVIKHGALGDFVLATGPFKAIRRHHPEAHITLLTAPAFSPLGQACGWFNEVWSDTRPNPWRAAAWLSLVRRLRSGRFDRVYDLQNSDRTSTYFRLLGEGRPQWSGIAPGCSLPHRTAHRSELHTIARQAEQLAIAGIDTVPPSDLGWAKADVSRYKIETPFALLVPGGAAHRPAKRWPATNYVKLAQHLGLSRTTPVLLGAEAERQVLGDIAVAAPGAINLCGQTNFEEIASLARAANTAIGNDTGPMHVIAAAGCPSIVLFSGASDPARTAPIGANVAILRRPALSELPVATVVASLTALEAGRTKAERSSE